MRLQSVDQFNRMSQIAWALASSVFLWSCAPSSSVFNSIEASSTNCSAGVAEILVGDGFLRTACGCSLQTESNGTTFPAPSNLTCHLTAANTTVFFYFLGTALRHQIVSMGSNSFPASPISDPNASYPIRVHAVTLSGSNTIYSFEDSFSGMQGQIFIP